MAVTLADVLNTRTREGAVITRLDATRDALIAASDAQRWALARRYLGHEGADGYIAATRDVTDRMCAIHIRPEHWLTRDYTKAGG